VLQCLGIRDHHADGLVPDLRDFVRFGDDANPVLLERVGADNMPITTPSGTAKSPLGAANRRFKST
jgi:hypothetical protein